MTGPGTKRQKGLLRKSAYRTVSSVRQVRNRLVNMIFPPVVVLIYHRVTTLGEDPQLLAVSPDNFREHLSYLKDNFPILRFEGDWGTVREPSVVVTFDDGYADNVLEALPVIEEVGVPVTFFVSTGTIGALREFWWDDLERLILGRGTFPSRFVLQDIQFNRTWPTMTLPEREALYSDIHTLMKKIDPIRRDGWIRQLIDWATLPVEGRKSHRAMTVDELRTLAASPWITIGAHTVSHTPLASLPATRQQEDILQSRQDLEGWLHRNITVFSYPFGGRRDYNQTSVRLCREAGFVRVAANFPGQVHSWTDHLQIPRQLVRNWGRVEFAERMKGFWYS